MIIQFMHMTAKNVHFGMDFCNLIQQFQLFAILTQLQLAIIHVLYVLLIMIQHNVELANQGIIFRVQLFLVAVVVYHQFVILIVQPAHCIMITLNV